MPMVSATDVPLQPYPTGRTSPQAPDAYQQIPTSPAMFGSLEGEMLQQAGQQGEKLATEVAKIGAYQKRYLDLAEVDKLASERDDERHKEYYGDPSAGVDPITGKALRPGLKNLYGSDAVDYIKSGAPSKAFNDSINRIAAGASNETVRQMFLHQSRAQRTAFDTAVGEHWTSQLLAHNKQTQEAKNSIAIRDAAAAKTDDELIDAVRRSVEAHVNALPSSDPVQAEAARREATGKIAGSAIGGALGRGEIDRARRLYDTFKDSFTGDQQNAISDRIEREGEQQRAKEENELGEDFANELLGRPTRGRAPGARAGGGHGGAAAATHYKQAIALGASPNEAALLTSAASVESGFDPTKSHDGGIGYGLFGHNRDRLAAMQKEFGPRPTAAQQIEFALKELRSRPEGARVNAAKTAEELTDLQLEFERPGIPNREARLAATRAFMRGPPSDGADSGTVVQMQGGGTRNLPIATTLNAQLERAATAVGDLKVEVFSGGQPRSGPNRVGSHRHDEGGAGDIQLRDVKTGRLLDMRKPEDQARMAKFITTAVAAGATGVGAAPDYMGPHGIHIGGGNVAVWGGDETQATAPGWVRAAFNAGRAGTPATLTPPGAQAATTGSSTTPVPTAAAGGDGAEPAAPAPAEKPPPDWAGMATRLRESNLPAGAKAKAMQIIENDKRMYEFGTAEYKTKYNAAALAAVEQRKDEIVQATVRSDDPAAHAKAQTDLAAIVKWGVDSGAVSANDAYRFERQAKGDLITGRAQYLDAIGQTEAALAYVQQNKDSLPAATFQQQVQSLQGKAEEAQGTRFARELRVGVGGVGQIGVPPPQGAPDFPLTLAPAPLQQRLQAIADSDLPDRAKKTARERIVAEHQLQIVGQGQAASDLNAAVESGLATRLDVEQAYRDERISPEARTSLNNKFDKIDADRLAAAQAMLKVENAGKGGAPLDPKSPEDKKALNYHFEQVTAAQEAANAMKRAQGLPVPDATANAIDYSVKYGLIPEKFKGAIRGNLHSGDPARIVVAADAIAQLNNRKPQLVSEIGDENDLRLAASVHSYAAAGVAPAKAVELATNGLKVTKLEREAREEQFDAVRGTTPKEQHDADVAWVNGKLNSFWAADPSAPAPNLDAIPAQMRKEFELISKAEYGLTGNLEAARTVALTAINNVWGRTRVGGDFRYMKQAPENPKFYGVPGLSERENAAWMNEQLLADISRGAPVDPTNPITADRLILIPSPDRKGPDGRPAYNVWLNHPVTGGDLVRQSNDPNLPPQNWTPDWQRSPERQRRDAGAQSEVSELRQERQRQQQFRQEESERLELVPR